MMDSHEFFKSLRYWIEVLNEQFDMKLDYKYYWGRLEGMLVIARDTGLISGSTWRTLYIGLNDLVMSRRNQYL